MRVFTCRACGHRMTLAGDQCGRCFADKPVVKMLGFYKVSGFALSLCLCGLVAVKLLALRP